MRFPVQIVSVIVAICCQDRFLLVKRREDDDIFPGKWENAGGKIEPGERVEAAIKREVKEEVGLDIHSDPVFLMSYSWKKENDPIRLGLIFLVKLDGLIKKYKINLESDLADFGWFTLKQLEKMNADDKLIAKGSPTGTLQQIKKAKFILI